MSTLSLKAATSRFAHYVGLSRASKAEEDENQITGAAASADDEGDGEGGDDGDDTAGDDREGAKKKGKAKKSTKASDDECEGDDNSEGDGDPKAEGDDNSEGDGDPKDAKKQGKAKKSTKASDDDDDEAEDDDERDPDKEMRGSSPVAAARRRENARCAAIFACQQAAGNLPLAMSLAFETRMPRSEAIAVLKKGGRAAGSSREASNPRGVTGGAAHLSPTAKTQTMWNAAFERVGVKSRK